jgi:hypothetical protein
MAKDADVKAETSAEKAYAVAAEGIASVKPEAGAAPVAEVAVIAPEAITAPAPAPAAAVDVMAVPLPNASPAVKAAPKAKPVAKVKVATKPKVAVPATPKVKATPKIKAAAKVTAKVTAAAAAKPVSKPATSKPATSKPTTSKPTTSKPTTSKPTTSKPTITAIAKAKDKTMSMTDKLTAGLGTVMTEAQAKAKEAFEKSSAMIGDYAAFTKGNVEAMVESGKIFAEGMQDMGTSLVAEGRTAFEAMSADMKEMAAAKSPTDLIQLQSEMMRKSFDGAVAYGSKNTEAMLKLASETMAPLASRVSLAVEKARQLAA